MLDFFQVCSLSDETKENGYVAFHRRPVPDLRQWIEWVNKIQLQNTILRERRHDVLY